jgi:hypothetical protein
MKKILLGLFAVSTAVSFAQTQLTNSGFENWESVAGSDEEPISWNSFLTATGSLNGNADSQIEWSSDVRPGSSGTKSCLIWSRSIFTIIANGNVTTGRINMGSFIPTGADNYNYSDIDATDGDFSEAMTDTPDSLVFWVKFIPNGHSENARVKATIHDDYEYRDPEDMAASSHIVATAVLNYPSTSNQWVRKSVPFDYSGPASTPAYMLLTFTTNETPGGGAGGDYVYIDDVELIYNSTSGIASNVIENINVFVSNETNTLNFKSTQPFDGTYAIYNMAGAQVQAGKMMHEVALDLTSGVYIVSYTDGTTARQEKIFVK